MKMSKILVLPLLCFAVLIATMTGCDNNNKSGFTELDQCAEMVKGQKYNELGFSGNQNIQLEGFYMWYAANGLESTCTNNAGDPFQPYDGLNTLKFWWLIKTVGEKKWNAQATQMLENTAYLKSKLGEIGWPCWVNDYSNTIFFKRPSDEIVKKYDLSNNYDDNFGGAISHIVVMQHVSKEIIEKFVSELIVN